MCAAGAIEVCLLCEELQDTVSYALFANVWREHKEKDVLYIFSNRVLSGTFAKIWWEGVKTMSQAQVHSCKFTVTAEAALEDQMQCQRMFQKLQERPCWCLSCNICLKTNTPAPFLNQGSSSLQLAQPDGENSQCTSLQWAFYIIPPLPLSSNAVAKGSTCSVLCVTGVVLAWLAARCPLKPFYHCPPQPERGEKIPQKSHRWR